jgi:small ligand-binding sensory domain FIST
MMCQGSTGECERIVGVTRLSPGPTGRRTISAMKWSSVLSERVETDDAVVEAATQLGQQLGRAEPDLVVAFVSPHHAGAYDTVSARVRDIFPRALLLGCSASGVIGAGHEVEERPALSLTAASLPGVQLRPLYIPPGKLTEAGSLVDLPPGSEAQFLLLCDTFTCDVDALIGALDRTWPSGRKVGGLASGGERPGGNALFCGPELRRSGAVGVVMTGDIAVDTIVAQGCRPVGEPMPITRAEGPVIRELGGKSPVDVLRSLYESLDERDQLLFRHSLFVGLEMDAEAIEYHANDFLVRNLVGIDPSSGALAVAAPVRLYQVVQFLLRDARTAEHDLVAHLERYRTDAHGAQPAGALLFSCLGRGMHLFGRPDHDTDLFLDRVGQVPLGGFFCNGEIGPVHGHTVVHGYTSAFGLFRRK